MVTQEFPRCWSLFLLLLKCRYIKFQLRFSFKYRIRHASSQPRREYQPKPRMSLEFPTGDNTQPNGGLSHTGTPKPTGKRLGLQHPWDASWWHFSRNSRGFSIWLITKQRISYEVILPGRNFERNTFFSHSFLPHLPSFLDLFYFLYAHQHLMFDFVKVKVNDFFMFYTPYDSSLHETECPWSLFSHIHHRKL